MDVRPRLTLPLLPFLLCYIHSTLVSPRNRLRSIRRRFDRSSAKPPVTGEGCRDGLETMNLLWLQPWCQAPLETWDSVLLLGPHTLRHGWRGVPPGKEHDLGVKWVFQLRTVPGAAGRVDAAVLRGCMGRTLRGMTLVWKLSVVPSYSFWKMSDRNHWGSGSWGGCWVIAAVIITISVMFKIVNKVEGGEMSYNLSLPLLQFHKAIIVFCQKETCE